MTLRIAGQVAPNANTDVDMYTVPEAQETVISSLAICNTGAQPTAFSIWLRVDEEAKATKNTLYSALPLAAGETFIATIGLTLATGNKITVRATTAGVSFQAWGEESEA